MSGGSRMRQSLSETTGAIAPAWPTGCRHRPPERRRPGSRRGQRRRGGPMVRARVCSWRSDDHPTRLVPGCGICGSRWTGAVVLSTPGVERPRTIFAPDGTHGQCPGMRFRWIVWPQPPPAAAKPTKGSRMRNIRTNPQAGLDDHTKKRRRGQSLVEFALILPILLTLTGAAIDVARVYGGWVALEGASRDAAEQ